MTNAVVRIPESSASALGLRALLLTALLLLTLVASARAKPLFSAPSLRFETGYRCTGVAIGDLNRDGRPDLAVARSGTVTVLFGNGDGTFTEKSDVTTGFYPQSIAIADLNGDSALDLVTANSGLSALSVMLGHGDGTFGARSDFEPGFGAGSVTVADINGDGRADLVTERSVYLGYGDGTFEARKDFGGGSAVAVGDINGDGRLDLVTNSGYDLDPDDFVGVGSVLLGNGDGTFEPPINFNTGYRPCAMAIADFNGDARTDVAVADFGNTPDYIGTVSVLSGNGDGTFGSPRSYGTGANPISVAAADFNGDGRQDVVTADYGDDPDWDFLAHTISVFLGNGDGTFRSAPKPNIGENPTLVAVGDLDANGTLDLVTPIWTADMVTVLLGNGDGTFGALDYLTGAGPYSVAVADLNADGWPDLAVANTGRQNIYVPGSGPGSVSILLGNGNGTFRAKSDIGVGTSTYGVAIADLNGDRKLDLALAYFSSNTAAVMLGNGNGTFEARTYYATGVGPYSIAIADFNGDGYPDLATPNYRGNSVSVLLGNGDGTFRARTDFDAGGSPISLGIADVNLDGTPDLAVAGSSVAVLLGNGDGTFAARNEMGGLGPVTIADINTDGRPDLVVSRAVMLGNGDGTFGPRIEFGAYGPVSVADFDGDGRPDAAAAFPDGDGYITMMLGRGDGTFGAHSLFGAGRYPNLPATADVDVDGRPDLVVPNSESNTVSVLLDHHEDIRRRQRRHPVAPRDEGHGVIGSSESSSRDIPADTAGRPGQIALAIQGSGLTRAADSRLQVEFALRDGSPARLELMDVAGRMLASRQVGAMGPGRHSLDLSAGRTVPPGIYFLRLSQGGSEARARVAVLR